MQSINPATGEVIREYQPLTDEQLDNRLKMAEEAFPTWSGTSFADRAQRMSRAAVLLREDHQRLARLMTDEMGKPIVAAEAEVEKCAVVCEYYAENAERFLQPQAVDTEASKSYVRYDPLGVILAVMPWNFPLWQVFRFAAPGLMAGNVGLLKHASNVPGVALAIEELLIRADFPAGVFSTLLISTDQIPGVIRHGAVRAVTLTGSERAGQAIAEEAGRQLKKTVLELGGSDPFLVLADADPAATARQAARARTINSGESCIAAKRFIVETAIADDFEQAFCQEMQQLKVGDPLDRDTEIGPLARPDLVDALHDQMARSLDAGARLLVGGRKLPQPGFYYAPTVLTEVEPGMPAFDEETFGPLAAVIRADDAEHAVMLANLSPYGLGASIWSGDPQRAEQLAPRIESGCVFINEMVKSDPRLPFGGIKRSGYGRELAEVGIREFVNIKTVWIK